MTYTAEKAFSELENRFEAIIQIAVIEKSEREQKISRGMTKKMFYNSSTQNSRK